MSIRTIPPREVFQLCREGESPCLLDVRTPAEFAEIHAEGTRLVPLQNLDPASLLAGHPAGRPIYVLCKSGGRAAQACQRFQAAGFSEAIVVEGGTVAWEKEGLPVVRGPKAPVSLERQVRIGAGAMILLGMILAFLVHPLFLIIPAFVGAGLVFAGVTDRCGMAMLLTRMPWNRVSSPSAQW